jgi:hypothetical protein
MKFILATCMYGRPLVSELFILNYLRLKKGFDITLVAAVSDPESEKLCTKYGIDHFYHENLPLGAKQNYLFSYILRVYKPNYIVHAGDDDLISTDLFSYYVGEAQKKTPYFGTDKVYFYCPSKSKACEFNYKSEYKKPIGGYRCFSAEMLMDYAYDMRATFRYDTWNGAYTYQAQQSYNLPSALFDFYSRWGKISYDNKDQAFNLWKEDLNKGLDFSSESRLVHYGFTPEIIELQTPEVVAIKSDQNIWSFESFESKAGVRKCSIEDATSFLSEEEKIFIKKYLVKKK